jgi:hypothetical protein
MVYSHRAAYFFVDQGTIAKPQPVGAGLPTDDDTGKRRAGLILSQHDERFPGK